MGAVRGNWHPSSRMLVTEEAMSSSAVLTAAWLERRTRLERSLHDGAQQQLLALQIAIVEASLPKSQTPWTEVARSIRTRLDGSIAEIVSLAEDNAPCDFIEGDGLGSLRRLAAASVLNVTCAVMDPVPAGSWERLAFDVCAEALHNAATSGQASAALIELTHENRLHAVGVGLVATVEITDNGIGGAKLVAGRGLDSLRGRLAAAGASLTVGTPELGAKHGWSGSSVCARIPFEATLSTELTAQRGTAEQSGAGSAVLTERRIRSLDRMVSNRLAQTALDPLTSARSLLETLDDQVGEHNRSQSLRAMAALVDEASVELREAVRRLRSWTPEDPSLSLEDLLNDAARRTQVKLTAVLDGEPAPSSTAVVVDLVEETMFGLGAGAEVSVGVRRRAGMHRVRIRFDGSLPPATVAVMEELARSIGSELTLASAAATSTSISSKRISLEVP